MMAENGNIRPPVDDLKRMQIHDVVFFLIDMLEVTFHDISWPLLGVHFFGEDLK